MTRTRLLLAAFCGLVFSATAHADTIKLLASTAMRDIISEIQPQFETTSGHTLVITWADTPKIKELVGAQPFDLVIVALPEIETFMLQGKVRLASRVDLTKPGASTTISSAILTTSGHADRAKTLQAFLAGAQAAPIIRKNGMEPARSR